MTVPAAYVLMLGTLGSLLLGWPLWWGVVIGAAASVVYLFGGGFRSVIRTDKLQFIAMFAGFLVILPYAVATYGDWSFIRANVPATHLTWHGGNTTLFILSWYFISASTLVEPSFYQRCYAAKSEAIARRGIFYSVAFWICFDFMTTTAGLYARAALPALKNPEASFPALASLVLPAGALGLFLVGLLATIISTVDSYMFLAAIALGRDFIGRLKVSTDRGVERATQWSLLAAAVLSIVLALCSRSVVGLWRDLGSIGVPVLLLPVLNTFRKSRAQTAAGRVLIWMLVPGIVSATWVAARVIGGHYPWGIEPIFPGIAVSLLLWPFAIQQR